MNKRIAVIPGDGIGVEVTREALRVLAALSLPVETVMFPWGADHFLAKGEALPRGAIDDLRDHFGAILFGAVGDPRVPSNIHARDILLALRFQLDLYINLRPVSLFEEWLTPLKGKTPRDIDMVILRENTEGLYAGVGGNFKKDTPDEVAINEDLNTRKGVDRILVSAFEIARKRRKHVTMVDKANALEHAHGLWRRAYAAMQQQFPDVKAGVLYVDVAAMEMVRNPERFDVVVTSNMFGDILTDLGAAIVGGLGVAASGNIHPGRCSLFEPVHGSAPDIAGKGIANPLGAILSLALLLEHIGEPAAAARVDAAVRQVVARREVTRDLGGTLSTINATERVLEAIGRA